MNDGREVAYQKAYWTLFTGLATGVGLMMLGTALMILPLITVGMLLLVCTMPLSYLSYPHP